jgi:Flp pilus assembly protein CpaB
VSQRRTLILVAAIAIGALASFLVWNYVGGIQDQAYSDAERVKVFLVKEPISRGTSGNVAQASIVPESIPRKFKPANAIVSLDDISGKVARADLVANQVLVQDMFVEASDPEAQTSFTDNLFQIQNQDQTTFTASFNEVSGAAGLIVPGDYVNVLTTDTDIGGGGEEGAAPATTETARYVYQKVQVLAVDYLTVGATTSAPAEGADPAAPPTATANVRKGLITFIVPPKAAQVLASVPPNTLYVSLVGKDYKPVPMDIVDLSTMPAEDPGQLTPYGPEGARSSD